MVPKCFPALPGKHAATTSIRIALGTAFGRSLSMPNSFGNTVTANKLKLLWKHMNLQLAPNAYQRCLGVWARVLRQDTAKTIWEHSARTRSRPATGRHKVQDQAEESGAPGYLQLVIAIWNGVIELAGKTVHNDAYLRKSL